MATDTWPATSSLWITVRAWVAVPGAHGSRPVYFPPVVLTGRSRRSEFTCGGCVPLSLNDGADANAAGIADRDF